VCCHFRLTAGWMVLRRGGVTPPVTVIPPMPSLRRLSVSYHHSREIASLESRVLSSSLGRWCKTRVSSTPAMQSDVLSVSMNWVAQCLQVRVELLSVIRLRQLGLSDIVLDLSHIHVPHLPVEHGTASSF